MCWVEQEVVVQLMNFPYESLSLRWRCAAQALSGRARLLRVRVHTAHQQQMPTTPIGHFGEKMENLRMFAEWDSECKELSKVYIILYHDCTTLFLFPSSQ